MRLKVLETAKRMGYVPNLSARSLVNRKSNLVGIMIHLKPDDPITKKQYYYDLAAHLQGELHQIGYDTVISMTHDLENIDIISKRSLEAAFIIDVDEKHFKKLQVNIMFLLFLWIVMLNYSCFIKYYRTILFC